MALGRFINIMFNNIPDVKLGIIAVSRDCFPIRLSEMRRAAVVSACAGLQLPVCEVKTTVENEKDMLKAVDEAKKAGCNALVVFLGNFGPETPETLIAKYFDGPCMFVAAAEGDGDLIDGRGDAYCGMLNCSYNLGMRRLKGHIPAYPVGTAADLAGMIAEFIPIARAVIGVKNLKIITFGPRPQDFFACNAPIKGLYELGVEIEENSELDLLVSFKAHAGDPRIPEVCADMAGEMGAGKFYSDLNVKLAQFELTLLDWAEAHRGSRQFVAFADKCWPAFPSQFGFVPCYVNSRLASRGIPVACEVDIYGALSEYIGACVTQDAVTLLDINNSVPKSMYDKGIAGKNLRRQCLSPDGHLYGLPLRQHALLQDEPRPGRQIPAHPAPHPGARGQRARLHPRHPGGRHRRRAHYLLPPAVRQRGRPALVYRRGPGAARADGELRRHRRLRHPGDGALLPPCAHRKALPPTTAPSRSPIAEKTLFDVFRFLGVGDIGWNQPKALPYPSENPFA